MPSLSLNGGIVRFSAGVRMIGPRCESRSTYSPVLSRTTVEMPCEASDEQMMQAHVVLPDPVVPRMQTCLFIASRGILADSFAGPFTLTSAWPMVIIRDSEDDGESISYTHRHRELAYDGQGCRRITFTF